MNVYARLGVALLVLAGCGRRPRPDSTLLVELGADGTVRAGGRPVDLDGLATQMATRREGAPSKPTARGIWCSKLDVVLRVAPDAYWRHVQWLLAVSEECKLYRTWFERADGRRLKVFQPVDMAIEWLPRTRALCVTIDIERTTHGGVRFRCGERTATNVNAVGTWVKEALERPGDYFIRVAELRAPATIRFAQVRAVMEALADTDIVRTWVFWNALPSKQVRESRRLPAPAADFAPRAGLGIREVPYDPDAGLLDESESEPPR